jgi:hypothetical protein
MPHLTKSSRPPVRLVPTYVDPERTYTINISTLAADENAAHDLAEAVLERVADLPGLLTASATVSLEEPVYRVVVKENS